MRMMDWFLILLRRWVNLNSEKYLMEGSCDVFLVNLFELRGLGMKEIEGCGCRCGKMWVIKMGLDLDYYLIGWKWVLVI